MQRFRLFYCEGVLWRRPGSFSKQVDDYRATLRFVIYLP